MDKPGRTDLVDQAIDARYPKMGPRYRPVTLTATFMRHFMKHAWRSVSFRTHFLVTGPTASALFVAWRTLMHGTRWASIVVLAACASGCHHDKKNGAGTTSGAPSNGVDIAGTVASAPTPAHEGQRPPRPTPVSSIPVPKLPTLKGQVTVPAPPKSKAQKDEFPCGSVWTGDEEAPLACDTTPSDAHIGPAAVVLIPYDVLKSPKADLPATVDHRLDGFEGRTLGQGKAGTCTAFSLTSQIDHAIGLWTGKPGDVSPMEIWARYHVGHNAGQANLGLSVANDADWPYDAARAAAWNKCKPGDDSCMTADERHKLEEVNKKGVVVLEQLEHLPEGEALFDVMAAKLAAGRDIGTGGKLPKAFHPVGEAGSKYIPDFPEVGTGAHAFTLTGYTHVEGERYFLVKNSWGTRWGDGGYAWIHEQSLKKIAHGGSVVVVDPIADKGLRRHKRKHGAVLACAAGKVPDSVDAVCKPPCDDGGPRHGGYCGTTEDCAHGFVNVAGYCVLAAPTAKGTEPKSGITFACAPSGCVYTLPKGAAGCAEATCQKSCPAPDFRLASGKGGAICLE